jgi:hypothetical protein
MKSLNRHIDFHPARNPIVRLNGVCPYFTMYPLPFPYDRLKGLDCGTRVLDPFCGRGTTNFAARLLGMASVGIDSNPIAHAIADSKLANASFEQVVEVCQNALRGRSAVTTPTGVFWEMCYEGNTLREICRIRRYFLDADELNDAEKLLLAITVGILHGPVTKGKPTYLSAQMPRTYATKPASAVNYWRTHGHEPKYVSVLDAVSRRAAYVLKQLPKITLGEVRRADSRQINSFEGLEDFDLVLTSPPYLGMRTYWPDQWLRNWFMGGADSVEYTKVEQIQSQEVKKFTDDLSLVWRNAAQVCRRRAKMVVRFGALPSYSDDPRVIIKNSIRLSDCGWRIDTIRDAGAADAGRRQAEQFNTKNSDPVREVDVYCTLAA